MQYIHSVVSIDELHEMCQMMTLLQSKETLPMFMGAAAKSLAKASKFRSVRK